MTADSDLRESIFEIAVSHHKLLFPSGFGSAVGNMKPGENWRFRNSPSANLETPLVPLGPLIAHIHIPIVCGPGRAECDEFKKCNGKFRAVAALQHFLLLQSRQRTADV